MENQNPQNDKLHKIREARKAALAQQNKAGAQLQEATKPTETKQNPLRKFLPPKPQPNQATTQPETFSNPAQTPNPEPGFSPYLKDIPKGSGTVNEPLSNPTPTPMPGTVGKSVKDFKPNLPTTDIPSERPGYRILGDRDLSREAAMQLIGNAQSLKDLERLQVNNDPEVMEGFERKYNELKNPKQQAQPQAKPVIDKPWWEDTWDGIRSGTRSALSALYEGTSEIADLVGTGGPANPAFLGQYNMLKQLQAKGMRGAGLGGRLREMADTESKRADIINQQADTESIGFFAGQMMPYVAGSAAAIATAPFFAPVAAGLGAANVGALALASVGSGLQEYDQYKAEKGTEVDPYARLGVGLLYGGAEFAMERLSLSKLMPKQFRGKIASAMFGGVPGEVMEKEAKQLVEEFANSSRSRRSMVDGLLKDTGKGMVVEGSTEAATEVAQEFTNWLYYENEDRYKWEELAKNTATAFAGGALMGAGLGPLSYASQRSVNSKRRKQTGKVVIAQNTKTGEAVEIMGISDPKAKTGSKKTDSGTVEGTIGSSITYDVVRPNGRVAQLTEDEVGEVVELPYDVFQGLLNGKVDGEAAIESRINQKQEQTAQDQAAQIRAKYEPYTFNHPIDGQQIAMGKKNGEPVYIKTPTSDGFVIVDEDGNESMVPRDQLTDITQMPFDAFLQQNIPPAQAQPQAFDPTKPIQVGEPINYEGENWVVTGVDTETGTVQLESQDNDGIFEDIPADVFQQLRKPTEELIKESTTDPAETGAGRLRELFTTGNTVDLGNVPTKPKEQLPSSYQIQQTIDYLVEKMNVPAIKAGDFHPSKVRDEVGKWMQENFGQSGEQLADIMEFTDAAKRLIDRMPKPEAVSTPPQNPSAPLEPVSTPLEPVSTPPQPSSPDQGGTGQAIANPVPAQSSNQGTDNQVQVNATDSTEINQNQSTITTDEVQQPQPSSQTGQNDVQNAQNQEDSTQEGEGQEGLEERLLDPSEYEDVNQASTPEQLAELYDAEVQNMEAIDPIDAAIARHVGKINPESFSRFGDRNNISQGLAGNWIAKKGTGLKIDLIAQEASQDYAGNEDYISPQDVIDFISRYSSADQITQPSGNPKLKSIHDKHIALTGKGLNRKTAEKAAKESKEKSLTKNNQGQLLESDDQIAEYLTNNPEIMDFLESEFGKTGEINFQEALDMLNADPDYFTMWPGGFKANEVDAIRRILTNLINEQANTKPGTDSTVQADSTAKGQNRPRSNRPEAQKPADEASARPSGTGDGQKPNSANPDQPTRPKSGGSEGTRSNPSDRVVVEDQPKKPTSLSELVNSPREKKTNPSTEPQATPVKEDLQDVGEKIGGSKKDGIKKYFDRINLNGRILSNIFPKPDIKSLLDSGLSVKDVGAIKVAYEFAVQDKKKGTEVMKFYAAYAKTVLAESINLEFKNDRYVFSDYGKSQIDLRTSAYEQVANQLGQEYLSLDLSKVRIIEMTEDIKKRIVFSNNEIKNFKVQYYVNTGKYFDTKQEALDQFVEEVKANTKTEIKGYKYKPGIFNVRSVGLVVGLSQRGKPFITIKDGFKNLKEASEYLKSNRDDIEIVIERILSEQKAQTEGKPKVSMKLINETSRDRVGKDWRNGKDVSSKEFADTFGLRAVEFGVWVNLKERQAFVNASYDSLMDLAQLMSIDPKSISLNGQLAISFGSRGSGQASAHYEPGKKVINLTKTKGLGSLAHEWYHAVDNYFAGFETGFKRMTSATLGESKPGTRQEVKAAFDRVYQSLQTGEYKKRSMRLDNKRNMDYYSTGHEMAARAFENYVLTRLNETGQVNDFLVNYVSNDNWKGEPNLYPYPIGEESVAIREAFDNLASTIQVDKSDPNRPMFLKVDPVKTTKKPTSLTEMMDTAMMRATVKPSSKPATKAQVQQWTDQVISQWGTKPKVTVFANSNEATKAFPELQPYEKELNQVPGLIVRNPETGITEVIMIASHAYLNNQKGVEITLLHEIIGHYGIREGLRRKAKGDLAKYDQMYSELMDMIFEAVKNDRMTADIARRYFGKTVKSLDQTQQRIVADEFIAHLAQSGVKDALIDRVIAKMREILRAIGFNLKFTDAEIRNLIGNSMRLVQSGNGPVVRPGIDSNSVPSLLIMGEQGATQLDQAQEVTFRIDNLSIAREMETIGKNPKEIKFATGWERGADGKWRYEIADGSWVNVEDVLNRTLQNQEQNLKLSDIYDNPEVYEAYPESRNIKVKFDPKPTPTGRESAQFNLETNELTLFTDRVRSEFEGKSAESIRSKTQDLRGLRKLINHELTHYIQNQEGFHNGSNTAFFDKARAYNQEIIKYMDQADKEVGLDNWVENVISDEKLNELYNSPDFSWDTLRQEYAKTLPEPRKSKYLSFIEKGKTTIDKNTAKIGGSKVLGLSSMEAYKRVAGEVEARNVVSRTDFTPEQRREQTLQSTEDIAREDQIFLEGFDSKVMSLSGQTESPAFKSWFGDSKVVDSDGNPLVVYHGTTSDFDQFKPRKKAPDTLFEKDFENDVYFFSNSADTANAYAESTGMNGASIMPVYVSIKNPYTIDRKGKGYRPNMMSAWIKQAKDAGHDGMIISNMADMGGNQNGTQYVAFQPTQIKSATGNQGTFDPNNADIRFMKVGASPIKVNSALAQEEKKAQTKLQRFFDKDRNIEKYQDNMIGSKRLIQRAEAKSGEKIRENQDFYTQENLSKGKVLIQTEAFERDFFNPIIETASQIATKYKFDSKDIGDYLVALHHGERKNYFQKKEKAEFMEKAEADYNARKDLQEKSTLAEYLTKQEAKIDKKIAEKDPQWPTGVTDDWASEKLKEFTDKVPKKLLDQLDQQVQAANKFVNDKRLESGLISPEVHATLATQYEHYVPLRGFEETQKDDLTVYSPLLAAHGRTSKAGNPIPFLVSAAQEAIVKGENNKVRQAALNFVKENVSPKDFQIRNGYYIKTGELDADGNEVWVETMDRPTKEQLESGEATRSFNPDTQKSVKTNNGDDNVLSVMVNGRKVFIHFADGSIAKAIKNTSQEQMGDTVKFMRRFSQHISRMYTQFSPEFGPRNLIRDLGFGTYNILVDDNPVVAAKTWKGIPKSANTLRKYFHSGNIPAGKDGEMLSEFLNEGTLTGYSDLKNVAKIYESASKEIEKINKKGIHKLAKIPGQGWDIMMHGLDTYNRSLENAVRFSYYKALREKGVSKQESARKAKDLTVNFNRKGNSSSVMGSIFVFFNASIQGSERLLRSFADPKVRKKAFGYAGAVVATGIAQGILNTLLMGIDDDDKETYAKIPDYIRRTNMIIPYGNGRYLAIPLPYGLNVFYAVGESIGRSLVSNVDPVKETLGLVSATMDSFSPFGGMEFDSDSQSDQNLQDLLLMFTPTMIKPAFEIAFNRDFAGRNIYPEPFPGAYQKPNSERHFKGVNPIIKAGTDWVNTATGGDNVTPGKVSINPEWIEHGINAYFGGPVSFAKNASTAVGNLIEGENIFSDPYSRNTPFYRSFAKKANSAYQSQQDFYQNYNKVKSAHQQVNQYKAQRNTEKYRETLDQHRNLINLYKPAENYRKRAKSINDRIDRLKSEDAKKNKPQIKKLEEQRTELFDAFNKRYNNATNPPSKKPESLMELFQ